jgi:hypothetical protein
LDLSVNEDLRVKARYNLERDSATISAQDKATLSDTSISRAFSAVSHNNRHVIDRSYKGHVETVGAHGKPAGFVDLQVANKLFRRGHLRGLTCAFFHFVAPATKKSYKDQQCALGFHAIPFLVSLHSVK